jgi:hypothetical protein
MTWPPTDDSGWADRVTAAGVRIDLWDTDLDDYQFAILAITILHAVRESTLSDEDVYPLLVRFWTGTRPAIDWPPNAPQVARRCATVLAARGTCELDSFISAPSDESLNAAREAIIADLGLTCGGLLSILADHWEQLAPLKMPLEGEYTLLAFARDVLLEPVVGACVHIWSTLDTGSASLPAPAQMLAWNGWCGDTSDQWASVIATEPTRLGQPVQHVPDDVDEATMRLAAARAAALQTHDEVAAIAASIVRTTTWPGDTDLILPLAIRAMDLARQHLDDINPDTDNDHLVDEIQRELLPPAHALIEWIRDPSFGTILDYAGFSRTGAEMLHQAADWITWTLANDAMEVFRAMLDVPPAKDRGAPDGGRPSPRRRRQTPGTPD